VHLVATTNNLAGTDDLRPGRFSREKSDPREKVFGKLAMLNQLVAAIRLAQIDAAAVKLREAQGNVEQYGQQFIARFAVGQCFSQVAFDRHALGRRSALADVLNRSDDDILAEVFARTHANFSRENPPAGALRPDFDDGR
jgi:hypothetical protein